MKESDKKIIIFGAGNERKTIATYITEIYKNIICIVDNDNKKWGKKINGYSVMQPDYICNYKDDENVIVVIATVHYHNEIKKQLSDLGWADERVMIAIDSKSFNTIEYLAYQKSVDLYNPIPTVLHIEMSAYCNCKCVYCNFHGEHNFKNRGFMSWETLDAIIELTQRIPTIETVNTTGAGEIFLNKNWYEMLEKLLIHTNIKYVTMYTNGMLLTEENVRKIAALSAEDVTVVISIDGASPKENDEWRIGSKYTVIRDNIHAAQEILKEYGGGVRFTVANSYSTELKEIEENYYKLPNANIANPAFLKNDFQGINIFSRRIANFTGCEYNGFDSVEIEWPEDTRSGCVDLFDVMAIDFEGNLLRCSCGQVGIERIGNIFSDDILDIWYHDEQMQNARKNFIENSLEKDFCTGCPAKGKGKYNILVKKEDARYFQHGKN